MRRAATDASGFEFAEARAADQDAVRRVVAAVLREYGLSGDRCGIDADLDDIQRNYLDRGGMFTVIGRGGEVVGCGGLYPIDSAEAEIRKMYLLPEARGRGLGSRLLRRLLEGARARGFARVTLETASVLMEAAALYRSFGFREARRDHYASRCDQAFELQLKDLRVREEP